MARRRGPRGLARGGPRAARFRCDRKARPQVRRPADGLRRRLGRAARRPHRRARDPHRRPARLRRLPPRRAPAVHRRPGRPLSAPAAPVGGGRLWKSLTARANYSLAQLLAQALHGLGLAAHAQERALAVGALLQHRAGGEDLPAQFLRRPGKEELGLDEAPLKNATIASRSLATSPSLFALITMQPGYFARKPASSPPRSILLK